MASSEATITTKEYIPIGQASHRRHRHAHTFNIYYELHGNGPRRVVFVMGLNQSRLSWTSQLSHFGRENSGYTALALDNRGIGNSLAPNDWSVWTVRDMADDVLEILDHVGWTTQIHLVGISMGGMIALELINLDSSRFASLTLTSTTAGGSSIPLAGVTGITKILLTRAPELRIPLIIELVFPKEHLNEPGPSNYKTNRDAYLPMMIERAKKIPPQPISSALNQIAAVLRHFVSPQRLEEIRANMEPTKKRILVVTGTNDNLVKPANSYFLAEKLNAKLQVYEGAGHVVITEKVSEYNELLENHFKNAEEMSKI